MDPNADGISHVKSGISQSSCTISQHRIGIGFEDLGGPARISLTFPRPDHDEFFIWNVMAVHVDIFSEGCRCQCGLEHKHNNSMIKHGIVLAGVLSLAVGGCASDRQEQAALLAQVRISKDQAAQAALAKTPGGRIKAAELDNDQGKLVWWFDIAIPGSKDITEVDVDALTGGVISVATETPEP